MVSFWLHRCFYTTSRYSTPGDGPLTIDLDSTICKTYGLAKEGARHHSYTSQRGYHPLLARAWTLGPAPATC